MISAVLLTAAAVLTLDAKIPLGDIEGRIDHLAFDAARSRLYVAELGNDSVGIVDLRAQRVIRTVTGFDEPQGVAYEASTDTVYVANGGDGSVRLFSGADFAPRGSIPLGKDADNVRVDRATHRVYVGYGDGALAVIDPIARKRVNDIPLKGHPESFQLDPAGDAIIVNVPDAGHIAVVSREANRQVASWPTGSLGANFPLTLDADKGRAIAVFRKPARLQAFDMRNGHALAGVDISSDSDDVFLDVKRRRLYVICGEGFVDVLDASGDTYTPMSRIPTSSGSRTGLFIPEIDRLLVAIRATGKDGAALWLFKPGESK
jgi:YVTN family beta-propeller protein